MVIDTSHPLSLEMVRRELNGADAEQMVRSAHGTFGPDLVMTTSFGAQSAVMLHLVTSIVPDIRVIWIDTGFNFPETYRFAEEVTKRLKLDLLVFQSDVSPARMVSLHGRLWEQGPDGLDRYHRIRKVEPRNRAFRQLGVRAWLTGPRRDQTEFRRKLNTVELFDGIYKIHPLLEWSGAQIQDYLKQHDLPTHPLVDQGYRSVGDWHSTAAINADGDERAGRFRGLKQECGLHVPETEEERASRDSSGL